jgi:formylglycine-generating enzyme required for sulfatase activity
MQKVLRTLLLILSSIIIGKLNAQFPLTSDNVFINGIFQNMIQINESTFISKYPVTIGDYKNFINEYNSKNQDSIGFIWNYSDNKYSSKEELIFYVNLKKENDLLLTTDYDKLPMVGLDRKNIHKFLSNIEFWCQSLAKKSSVIKTIRLRIPTVKEWESIADKTFLLNDPNTGEKKCNYFEIPQSWIHLNSKTNQHEILFPFDGYVSELYKTHTWLTFTNVDLYTANKKGFYDLYGNASEMMYDENQLRGGNCLSTGYDIINATSLQSDTLPFLIGFRIVIEIIK